jgi:hypothetical protein
MSIDKYEDSASKLSQRMSSMYRMTLLKLLFGDEQGNVVDARMQLDKDEEGWKTPHDVSRIAPFWEKCSTFLCS